MGIEKMVNDLYKFLQTDVTNKQLFEATDSAYKGLKEGKLPADLSIVEKPTDYIKLLMEKGTDGDVKPAEMTDEVALSKVEKEEAKKTPDIEKKTDPIATAKIATKEGKLPADLSQIQKPTDEIYQLAENEVETPLTVVPDEATANSIVNKVGTGKSRAEKNSKGQFTVYTKEAKKAEKNPKVTGVEVKGAKDAKDVIKKQQESKIKEETTTEMPAVKAAAVPDVSTDGTKAVDASPVAKANPDNKDKEGIAGEVNNDSGIDKVAKANPDNKDGAVIKEDATTEPTKGEVKAAEVPEVDANKKTDVDMGAVNKANPDTKDGKEIKGEPNVSANADKIVNAAPDNKDSASIVKEEVQVDVKAEDQVVTVTADDQGGTTVTTSGAPTDVVTTDVTAPEVPAVDGEATETDEEAFEDELVDGEMEVAEKIFLADYLGSKKKLSEKETKFIKEARSIKLSTAAWERVHKKVASMKAGK